MDNIMYSKMYSSQHYASVMLNMQKYFVPYEFSKDTFLKQNLIVARNLTYPNKGTVYFSQIRINAIQKW